MFGLVHCVRFPPSWPPLWDLSSKILKNRRALRKCGYCNSGYKFLWKVRIYQFHIWDVSAMPRVALRIKLVRIHVGKFSLRGLSHEMNAISHIFYLLFFFAGGGAKSSFNVIVKVINFRVESYEHSLWACIAKWSVGGCRARSCCAWMSMWDNGRWLSDLNINFGIMR